MVRGLPLVVASAVALGIAPSLLASMRAGGHVRPNWRGQELVFPFGVLVVAAATIALVPLALVAQIGDSVVFDERTTQVLVFALGVGALGLIDDVLGQPARGVEVAPRGGPRGWRGHGSAVLHGAFSTGALKAAGTLGLALLVMLRPGGSTGKALLAAGVLVLATNLFNLLDLRPGRSVKAFALLAAGLTIGTMDLGPLKAIGILGGPVLIAGLYDLRERAMLGDAGANLIGALAGLWLVFSLHTTGQAIALVVLAALTAYGEFRSISTAIERIPGLRQLDRLGRVRHD